MKGITEWLASIGLSEYAQRFADNAIDLSVVREEAYQRQEEATETGRIITERAIIVAGVPISRAIQTIACWRCRFWACTTDISER